MTTAIVVNLAAVVATTIVALAVQQFHFDVEITLWTQHFDLGPLRFFLLALVLPAVAARLGHSYLRWPLGLRCCRLEDRNRPVPT